MNWNCIEGQWKRAKGTLHERWGRWAHDEGVRARGLREQVDGAIQRAYGKCVDAIERERDIWSNSLDDVAI